MKIYIDMILSGEARTLLEKRASSHELIFSKGAGRSVLDQPPPDPEFQTAEIAFGQPAVEAIRNNDRLRWIHISSSGFTRYDNHPFREMMKKRNIPVTNSAGVYDRPCAVHALSFMLAQARRLPNTLHSQAPAGSDEWLELRHESSALRGERVVILGFGAIGEILVDLLRPFEMEIFAYRRKARGDEPVPVLTADELERLLEDGVDHIINILPASEETEHFFDEERFSRIRPGAVFYNIGRGTTVDQSALLSALRSGRLKAAWLDVTDPEPLPEGHPLLRQENSHITPHLAGGHRNEQITLVTHFLKNLERFEKGEPLMDRIM